MPNADRLPWFRFYPRDWRADAALRSASITTRGVWIELLALMHDAPVYGHLLMPGGNSPSDQLLAKTISTSVKVVRCALAELDQLGILSRTPDGVLYSRRMVRDAEKARKDSENGRLGGNPKVKAGVNPPVNPTVNPDSEGGVKARARARADSDSVSDLDLGFSSRSGGLLMPPARGDVAHPGRVFVPGFLHAEFLRKSLLDDRALRAWYADVDREWASRTIGDDNLTFWRARFTERFGTTKPIGAPGPARDTSRPYAKPLVPSHVQPD